MSYEAVGKLHKKFETESKSQTFQARDFVLEVEDGAYPQFIKFQLVLTVHSFTSPYCYCILYNYLWNKIVPSTNDCDITLPPSDIIVLSTTNQFIFREKYIFTAIWDFPYRHIPGVSNVIRDEIAHI